MARPPLSREELERQAWWVVVGRPEQITEDGADVTMQFRVETIESAMMPLEGDVVAVHYNRGLGDDEGQHSALFEGEHVRLFLAADQSAGGRLTLLEPNGWEPA